MMTCGSVIIVEKVGRRKVNKYTIRTSHTLEAWKMPALWISLNLVHPGENLLLFCVWENFHSVSQEEEEKGDKC